MVDPQKAGSAFSRFGDEDIERMRDMRRAGGSYEAIGEEFGCSKSVAWHHTHDVKLDQSEENPETKPLDAKIRMSVPLEFSSQEILDLQNRARGRGFDSISDYLFHLESVAALQQRQSTMVVPAKPRDEFDVESEKLLKQYKLKVLKSLMPQEKPESQPQVSFGEKMVGMIDALTAQGKTKGEIRLITMFAQKFLGKDKGLDAETARVLAEEEVSRILDQQVEAMEALVKRGYDAEAAGELMCLINPLLLKGIPPWQAVQVAEQARARRLNPVLALRLYN